MHRAAGHVARRSCSALQQVSTAPVLPQASQRRAHRSAALRPAVSAAVGGGEGAGSQVQRQPPSGPHVRHIRALHGSTELAPRLTHERYSVSPHQPQRGCVPVGGPPPAGPRGSRSAPPLPPLPAPTSATPSLGWAVSPEARGGVRGVLSPARLLRRVGYATWLLASLVSSSPPEGCRRAAPRALAPWGDASAVEPGLAPKGGRGLSSCSPVTRPRLCPDAAVCSGAVRSPARRSRLRGAPPPSSPRSPSGASP